MRWLACLILCTLPSVGGAEFLSTTLVRGQDSLALNGIGTVRQLNLNYYHVAFYIDQTSSQSEFVLDARRKRVLHLHVTADRLFASSTARHFREMIHLNNNRADIEKEFDNLTRFYQIFRHGLARGDEIVIDASDARSTRIYINGTEQIRVNSPLFFNLLMRCYVGAQPPSQQLKNDVLNLNTTTVTQQLGDINSLSAQESRVDLYKNVSALAAIKTTPTPATVAPVVVAPVAATPAPVISTPPPATSPPAVAANSSTKPSNSNNKPTPQNTARPTENPSKAATPPEAQLAVTSANKTEPVPTATPAEKPTSPTVIASASPLKPISDTDAAELLASYQLALEKLLQTHLEYPKRELKQKYGLTQMARVKGSIILNLNLDRSGEINAISYVQKSPDPILDEAAMSTIEKQAPFTPLSNQLSESSYEFYVELKFDPNQ